MKLVWTATAREDRRSIYDHIEAENAAAALSIDELISKDALQISQCPMTGRPVASRKPGSSSFIATMC